MSSLRSNGKVNQQSSSQDTQQLLKTLIEGDHLRSWTYAIFWQSSVDNRTGANLLTWGDGYYKGCDNPTSSANSAEQENRKRVLSELSSLISGGGSDDDDPVEEEVMDAEWFFLVSMTKEFVDASGLPGQARTNRTPIWVAGGHGLASAPCERAWQANMLGLQTMALVPVSNGVVELGSTEVIMSSSEIVDQIQVSFSPQV